MSKEYVRLPVREAIALLQRVTQHLPEIIGSDFKLRAAEYSVSAGDVLTLVAELADRVQLIALPEDEVDRCVRFADLAGAGSTTRVLAQEVRRCHALLELREAPDVADQDVRHALATMEQFVENMKARGSETSYVHAVDILCKRVKAGSHEAALEYAVMHAAIYHALGYEQPVDAHAMQELILEGIADARGEAPRLQNLLDEQVGANGRLREALEKSEARLAASRTERRQLHGDKVRLLAGIDGAVACLRPFSETRSGRFPLANAAVIAVHEFAESSEVSGACSLCGWPERSQVHTAKPGQVLEEVRLPIEVKDPLDNHLSFFNGDPTPMAPLWSGDPPGSLVTDGVTLTAAEHPHGTTPIAEDAQPSPGSIETVLMVAEVDETGALTGASILEDLPAGADDITAQDLDEHDDDEQAQIDNEETDDGYPS